MRTGKGGIIFVLKLSALAAVKVTFNIHSQLCRTMNLPTYSQYPGLLLLFS
jgi:hypothetical protein